MYELKYYQTESGFKPVLVGPTARTRFPVLLIEGNGLTVRKLPLDEARYMKDVRETKKRRSISGLIRQYRAIGRKLGMTKAAKQFLTQANKAA